MNFRSETKWQLLEERHTYAGDTHEQVAATCRADMEVALSEGYLAERIEWSPDGLQVAVTYAYDPARAGRPL
jgi:hypothetical protein